MQTPVHSVTAIVVAHDGARWLGETLSAVLGQTYRLDRVVGVDNGSRDDSAKLLTQAFGPAAVVSMPRSTGFAEAVHDVMRRLPPAPHGTEWIWLLHDDCAPDPRALEALLWAAGQDDKAVILGPKLRDWLDRKLLLEIGVTVARSGRRETGLEPREYDQGQHDHETGGIRDVLSVSTAGMLIRRDVWDELSGLDPKLPLFRDDLDFCWRARAAGYRVLNVTEAMAYHAEASSRRRRRIAASDDHPRRLARRYALFVIMINLPFPAMLWSMLRNTFGSMIRTFLFLVAKQPAHALDEIVALGSVLAHPGKLRRARKARRRNRKQGYQLVKPLFTPPIAALRRIADMVRGQLAGAGPMDSAGRHHAVASSPEEEGDELLNDDGSLLRRVFGNPGVLLVLLLTAVTVAAFWRLPTGGLLGGGALVPVAGGASDLWDLYLTGNQAPYVAVLAALSTIFFGKIWLAVAVLLLGCVPLAGFSAYAATRRLIPYAPGRVWLAASYALLPVATGVVAAGRLGSAVVIVLLPVYASLATRVLADGGRPARRAAWGLGLLLTVGTAFVPLLYGFVFVLGALAALSFGGVRRGVGVSLAISLAVPILLLFPWLAGFAADPARVLREAGLPLPADPRLPAEALLTLNPGGPGAPPLWTTAGLLAVALGALLLRRHQLIVAVGWGVAISGVLVATVVSRLSVWPGVPLAFAATGLLVSTALAAHRVAEFRAAGGWRRFAALLVSVVAFATPLAAAGLWIRTGAGGPLSWNVRDPLPALAAAKSTAGEGTLVLRPSGGALAYTVLHGRSPLVGESDGAVTDPAVTAAVAGLASGRGGKDAQELAARGVTFVTVPAPVDPALQRSLDSEPALTRLSLSKTAGLWRMVIPVAPPAPPPPLDAFERGWLWAQGALVVLVLILAAPGARQPEPEVQLEEQVAGERVLV
ncbi:glycosyltransferase [Acrocarpospora phusangensis]|uniref:glycosyltransferase n=1 Tax=Acrocarpospora phusangensis TaxID=1070424 RepID=UPI001EF383EA|nr:glycosyltransferase [Acrocarpospora phusangensis]